MAHLVLRTIDGAADLLLEELRAMPSVRSICQLSAETVECAVDGPWDELVACTLYFTLAVGAPQERGSAKGIGGVQTTRNLQSAGSVYVFTRDGAQQWSQRTYVKASNTNAGDQFGFSVGLSGDGDTLAVGALFEASSATGLDGDQGDNSAISGAAYLY